jgi:hypothetical protein
LVGITVRRAQAPLLAPVVVVGILLINPTPAAAQFEVEILRGTQRTVEGPDTDYDPRIKEYSAGAVAETDDDDSTEVLRIVIYVGDSDEDRDEVYYRTYWTGSPTRFQRKMHNGFTRPRSILFPGRRIIRQRNPMSRSIRSIRPLRGPRLHSKPFVVAPRRR